MNPKESNPTETTATGEAEPLDFDPFITAFLKENCRKQQEAIQELEDSAYVVRNGRRELQDPKRLALAVQLRGKFMVDFIAVAPAQLGAERSHAFWNAVIEEVAAESPERRLNIMRRLDHFNRTYKFPQS